MRSLIRKFIGSRLGIIVYILQATVNTSAESVHSSLSEKIVDSTLGIVTCLLVVLQIRWRREPSQSIESSPRRTPTWRWASLPIC